MSNTKLLLLNLDMSIFQLENKTFVKELSNKLPFQKLGLECCEP